ncbi:murein biosynthesis integral membrane protein MurJ [Metaclostridioides mangenotii]|uniref:murein biosynthesis integral membrane protein MurJ n=1 Tax=Metaclostridioides mangenotii TaxID=1540 RepID=UPI000465FAAB|nr:murein biosynthesis integral membrane protein MurJ [Clostridioides mangenotii]
MSKVAKATLGLMVVTMLSKCLGFAREVVLGAAYGLESDMYIMAMNIPRVLFALLATAIATTFIPLFYENQKKGGDENALKFSNNIINITLILGIILSILAFIFAEPIVRVFAFGYKGDKFTQTVIFTRIMIFGGLFSGLSSIMTSYLQINGSFKIPGLTGIPFNIIIIVSIVLSIKLNNIYILPIGTLLAMASQFLFQIPYAYKKGYRYKAVFDLKDEYIKKIIYLVSPVFIGVAISQINTTVDRALASTLNNGSVAALNYANRLNGFVMGLFIASVGAVIYPMLSKFSLNNDNEHFSESIVKSTNIIVLLVMPISIGAIFLSTPIVRFLFERGKFDSQATQMTAIALVFYAVGMLGFGLREILTKVFYSLQDTKTPMINGVICMILNIVFNLVLIRFMGHAGLALGTSLSALICIYLLFRSLKNRIGDFGQGDIFKVMIKTLISSIFMGVAVFFIHRLLSDILGTGFIGEAISLFGSIGIGVSIYLLLIYLLKIEEINIVTDLIKTRLKNRSI